MVDRAGRDGPGATGAGQVTGLAQVCDADVATGQTMTTIAGTTALNLVVVDTGRGPAREGGGIMAGIADVAGADVAIGLAVTTATDTVDFVVVDLAGLDGPVDPGRGQMAALAQVAGVDVNAALAVGDGAVVETDATAVDLVVVDLLCRCPGDGARGVAGVADG